MSAAGRGIARVAGVAAALRRLAAVLVEHASALVDHAQQIDRETFAAEMRRLERRDARHLPSRSEGAAGRTAKRTGPPKPPVARSLGVLSGARASVSLFAKDGRQVARARRVRRIGRRTTLSAGPTGHG